MALSDLVTSLPGLILVATLPGVALASLLVPRWPWWQWLAAAPGLSAGMIGVLGLLYHDLGVPFEPLTVLPVLLAVVGAASGVRVLGRGRFLDGGRRQHLPGWPTAVVIAAALFAGGLSAGVATSELGRIALPFATDAPVHAFVAEKAAQTHDVLPVQPVPANGSGVVRPRTGFESTAVAVSWVAGPRPAMTMLPLALLAVLLLPLSLAMLAVEATGAWRIAALAPLLALGMPFPRFPIVLGELPIITDSTLIVPLVITALHAARGRDVRAGAAFTAATISAIWVVHGLEAITAVVIGGPLILAAIGWQVRSGLRRLVPLLGTGLAAALLVTALTRLPAVPPVRPEPGVLLTSAAATHFTGILGTTHDAPEVVNVFRNSVLVTPFAFVLYVGGMTACLLRRNLRWAIVANLIIVGCLADAAYGAKLHTLWDAIFPWATLDRLLSIQYWVVPLIMAFGLVSVATVLRRLATSARSRAAAAARRPALALVSAGAAVVVVTVVSGANNDRGVYAQAVDVHGLATSADMAALRAMDHALAPGSVVLTNSSTDAGQWIDALTAEREYAPSPYQRNIVDSQGRVVGVDPRSVALRRACADPKAAAEALSGIDAIYLGSRTRPGDPPGWEASCLERIPGLMPIVIARDGHAAATVYRVTSATARR